MSYLILDILTYVGPSSKASDRVFIEVVHANYEDNSKEDNEEIYLMVELEKKVVMSNRISLEYLFEVKSPSEDVHVDVVCCVVN